MPDEFEAGQQGTDMGQHPSDNNRANGHATQHLTFENGLNLRFSFSHFPILHPLLSSHIHRRGEGVGKKISTDVIEWNGGGE
jgi:hypothetical protein